MYDVVIVGGGPAGLSAALTLGRAQKRILLTDAGAPRNGAAHQVHNFVTRDGTPPAEFRHLARAQLTPYETVELSDQLVEAIDGERDGFRVRLGAGREVEARRVLLCVGMVDVLPELPGYRALWGQSIFQCPYCHGFEVRDRPFGYLLRALAAVDFALLLRCWSRDVVVFTDGKIALPDDARARLTAASIQIEERPIARLVPSEQPASPARLGAVQLADGTRIAREILFDRPPQRQTALVQQLGLALDEQGFVCVDPLHRQTSRAGIYAAGDLMTMMQAAVVAAAAGMQAAAMLNHDLTLAAALETRSA